MSVLVIGSINADQVVITNRIPNMGETVVGTSFKIVPGGKGANQAVAASRLGEKTDFIGCVGDDTNGTFLLQNFTDNNIDISNIKKVSDTTTGIAVITVCNGENRIIVVPGANELVDKQLIDEKIDLIKNSKAVILQLEIPYETVKYIVDICHQNNIMVVLNPAPAYKLDEDIINKVTYLTPNEHEAEYIFGSNNYEELVYKYHNKLVITLGEKGAIFNDGKENVVVPANKVEVVDTNWCWRHL